MKVQIILAAFVGGVHGGTSRDSVGMKCIPRAIALCFLGLPFGLEWEYSRVKVYYDEQSREQDADGSMNLSLATADQGSTTFQLSPNEASASELMLPW